MQIREIHIDGFGIFNDSHFSGLTSGINVLYGCNEFGKSTLLSFIRRILFGFPRTSSKVNPYPALNGGTYGGRIVCELANGQVVAIARGDGPHGGSVTISYDSKYLNGQGELNDMLGPLSRALYENVYAISLDELQAIDTLQEDDVKNRIYGAGLELGGISLGDVQKELENDKESYYKERGSAQLIPRMGNEVRELERDIRKIEDEIQQYDELIEERDRLTVANKSFEGQFGKIEKDRISTKNKLDLYPEYLKYCEYQDELCNIRDLPDFTGETLERFEEINSSEKTLLGKKREYDEDIKDLEIELRSLNYNQAIIDLETEIVKLQKKTDAYKSAKQDIGGICENEKKLEYAITTRINGLGGQWSIERVKAFNTGEIVKTEISSFSKKFDQSKASVEKIKSKIEVRKDELARQASAGFSGSGFYRYSIYAITLLSFFGIVAGVSLSQWALLGLSAPLFALGLIISLKIRTQPQENAKDPMLQRYGEELRECESASSLLLIEWEDFLTRAGIGNEKDISVEKAAHIVDEISRIQIDILNEEEFKNRIQKMQTSLEKVQELHNSIAARFERNSISDDLIANIEIFNAQLNQAKSIKTDFQNKAEQLKKLAQKMDGLKRQIEGIETEKKEFLSSFGCSSGIELQSEYAKYQRRKFLHDEIEKITTLIKKTVGTGSHFQDFLESIKLTDPEELELNLSGINAKLKQLNQQRDENNQKIGELNNKISEISSSNELLSKLGELEQKKQTLNDYSREWMKSTISFFVLNKAISKYENTRQPSVIEAAQETFAKITGNRYVKIVKPIDSEELLIKDEHGRSKRVIEMSRGTKEQLYLAMRLGLIQEYENRCEPMPIIMDDILVNFDDDRGPLAITALKEFAENRQILIFTCHNHTLDLYTKLGANEVKCSA